MVLSLPRGIATVWLNVGAFENPVLPPSNNPSVAVVAFEPISKTRERIAHYCNHHETMICNSTAVRMRGLPCSICDRLIVIGAAVSNSSSLGTMKLYNYGGVASSLSSANSALNFSFTKRTGEMTKSHLPAWMQAAPKHAQNHLEPYRGIVNEHVPVLSFADVLDAIPSHIDLPYAKLDMQGYDFLAFASAGRAARRLRYVTHECWEDGSTPFYSGVSNFFKSDWKPHMNRIGFRLYAKNNAWGHRTRHIHVQELDIQWIRDDVDAKRWVWPGKPY